MVSSYSLACAVAAASIWHQDTSAQKIMARFNVTPLRLRGELLKTGATCAYNTACIAQQKTHRTTPSKAERDTQETGRLVSMKVIVVHKYRIRLIFATYAGSNDAQGVRPSLFSRLIGITKSTKDEVSMLFSMIVHVFLYSRTLCNSSDLSATSCHAIAVVGIGR
jgi:hypothetical protein